MYREIRLVYRQLNLIIDAIVAGAAYLSALYIETYTSTGTLHISNHAISYSWLLCPIVIVWPTMLVINGLYPTNRLRGFRETVQIICYSGLQVTAILFTMLFIINIGYANRNTLISFILLSTAFFIAKEWIIRWLIHNARKSGANLRRVLIVGTSDSVDYIIKKINSNESLGLVSSGVLLPPQETYESEISGTRILGGFNDIEKVLHSNLIDIVILTSSMWPHYEHLENIISRCDEEGIEVWLPARIFHVKVAKPEGDELLEVPMFVFRTEPKFSWQMLIKIVIDRVFGLVFTILSFPIIVIAAIFIKLTSPGPVIFKQNRCGYHGRIFTLYKLRTMYINAEEAKKDLVKHNTMTGPIFKMDRDPRITSIGRILRKTSIDEMPQFWNILEGHMSLVGPRPPTPDEVCNYHGWHRRRLNMKPGLTGLVQVSGRSNIVDFTTWADLDLEYIDDWSLWLDIKILFKTIIVVLSTKGAK